MKLPFPEATERGRMKTPGYPHEPGDPYGYFLFRSPDEPKPSRILLVGQPPPRSVRMLQVIAAAGIQENWIEAGFKLPAFDHVSVTVARQDGSTVEECPTWAEMSAIKSMFWADDETVLQYHPPKEEHVNFHPWCLHLWKPIGVVIPLPPRGAI